VSKKRAQLPLIAPPCSYSKDANRPPPPPWTPPKHILEAARHRVEEKLHLEKKEAYTVAMVRNSESTALNDMMCHGTKHALWYLLLLQKRSDIAAKSELTLLASLIKPAKAEEAFTILQLFPDSATASHDDWYTV